jgi:hypothetical protein
VMRPEPFFSHAGQEGISPDEDALLLMRQKRMRAACDWKVDAGGTWCRGASFQKEQNGEDACECDGRADAMPSSHNLEL